MANDNPHGQDRPGPAPRPLYKWLNDMPMTDSVLSPENTVPMFREPPHVKAKRRTTLEELTSEGPDPNATESDEQLLEEMRKLYNIGIKVNQYITMHPYPRETASLTAKLFKHQAAAVGRMKWLYGRANGCFLADGPGAGKTLEMLALLLDVDLHREGKPHLLLIPASLMAKWRKDILETQIADLDRWNIVFFHEGEKAKHNETTLGKVDIVVTTYDAVAGEMRMFEDYRRAFVRNSESFASRLADIARLARLPYVEPTKVQARARRIEDESHEKRSKHREWPLLNIHWNIVAMDEAHIARNPESDYFQSVMQIKRELLIAATGTRLQNTYSELLSLCRILRVPGLTDVDFFDRCFTKNVLHEPGSTKKGALDHEMKKYEYLGAMLNTVTIQRNKNRLFEGELVAPIASYLQNRVAVTLDCHTPLDKWYLNGNEEMYPFITTAQDTQLMCKRFWDPSFAVALLNTQELEAYQATIDKGNFSVIREGWLASTHPAAPYATGKIFKAGDEAENEVEEDTIPATCKAYYNGFFLREIALHERWRSAKIDKVIADVRRHVSAHIASPDTTGKVLIFGRSVILNNILRIGLEDRLGTMRGVSIAKVDGTLTEVQWRKEIDSFMDPRGGHNILVCSMKAASVGIELTTAAQVIFFQPDWNPMAEEQAIARAHRYPNKDQVHVTRYVARNSMDIRVHAKQMVKEQKAAFFNGSKDYSQGMKPCLSTKELQDVLGEELIFHRQK